MMKDLQKKRAFSRLPRIILYKIDSTTLDLRSGEQVKFILRRGDNLPEVTATTTVLGDMILKSPNAAVPDPKFSFIYEFNEDVSFSAPSEAVIFDIRLRLNYLEFEKGKCRSNTAKQICDLDLG